MNGMDPLEGFPSSVTGNLVFDSFSRHGQDAHIFHLSESDLWGVQAALETFRHSELGGEDISRDTFQLPSSLQRMLSNVKRDVYEGAGYGIIKGIDPTEYSAEDNLLLYLGIIDYIGPIRGVQNRHGDIITHVTVADTWGNVPDAKRHGLHTNQELPPHNDMGSEILCLSVRSCSTKGGSTYIASSWRIYNDLATEHREVLKELATPTWPIQVSGQSTRYILAPLIAYYDSKILLNFDPGRLGAHPSLDVSQRERIPSLTSAQLTALDTVSTLARKHRVRLDLGPGDIVLINNWALLHGRDSYTDGDNYRRHLIRVWIRNPELGWKIPDNMRFAWEMAYGLLEDQDKGQEQSDSEDSEVEDEVPVVTVKPYTLVRRRYDVVPVPKYKIPQYTAGSACFLIDDDEQEDK